MAERFGYGADIGGTTVKLGLFSSEGGLVEKWAIPTRTKEKGAFILPDVAAAINAHRKAKAIEAVGLAVGVPATVMGDGWVEQGTNIGWDRLAAQEILEELTALPVQLLNDANAAALGECARGGGQGYRSLVLVTLGTGVGGGIVIDGNVLNGFGGAAGEIGHIIVNAAETRLCNCGRRGCLEFYASAPGLVRLAEEQLAADPQPSALRDIPLSAAAIWDAAKAGDRAAQAVTAEYCRYLALGLSQISVVVDPEVFILGGGVSAAGNALLEATAKAYREVAYPTCRHTKFTLAKLGNDAGLYGCAAQLFGAE